MTQDASIVVLIMNPLRIGQSLHCISNDSRGCVQKLRLFRDAQEVHHVRTLLGSLGSFVIQGCGCIWHTHRHRQSKVPFFLESWCSVSSCHIFIRRLNSHAFGTCVSFMTSVLWFHSPCHMLGFVGKGFSHRESQRA